MNEKLRICPNGYHYNGDPECTCGTKNTTQETTPQPNQFSKESKMVETEPWEYAVNKIMSQCRDNMPGTFLAMENLIISLLNTQREEILKEVERNVEDLQSEHANMARHGNTPDDAYGRVANMLWEMKQDTVY